MPGPLAPPSSRRAARGPRMAVALLHDALDAVLPRVCAGCGQRAPALCGACAASLRRAPAAPPPRGVDWWAAAFSYEGVGREVVARAKYRDGRAALTHLAPVVAGACPPGVHVDVVTWVPASRARRIARGVDHAQVLARGVGRALGLPVTSLLVRGPGPAQTGRARASRRAGPTLHAVRRADACAVLVVDDVATTGATAAAAARVLRGAGAVSIGVLTAARTPRPGAV